MDLLNKYLSAFQFKETHSIDVNANPEACYNAAKKLDLAESGVISTLFKLRGIPFNRTLLNEITQEMKFTLLEEVRYNEFLYAFWFKRKVEWITDKDLFTKNRNDEYNAKVGWSFSFVAGDNGVTKVQTETRILCFNKKTLILFGLYWFFIRIFSGWTRIEMLKLIKKHAENNS